MAKQKTIFVCQSCGNTSAKWLGKCPSCGQWNTFHEEIQNAEPANQKGSLFTRGNTVEKKEAKLLKDIELNEQRRFPLKDVELSRVLGGGIVPGSLILFGGQPGIGKSTLLLQISLQHAYYKTLYISGEESEEQIKLRAERIGSNHNNLLVLTENNIEHILEQVKTQEPDLLIIDSIQTLYTSKLESAPGTVSQIRDCTAELLQMAKTYGIAVFLVGHITKEGSLAGPKVLEHMVDTVIQFEGDRNNLYRIIRSIKNRFGSTNELGIYEMNQYGLKPVENPSDLLISEMNQDLSGIAIGCTMEGNRALLIEIQALVSTAVYGTPQRSTTGYDGRRLNMLLAVLEKKCGFNLAGKDVFLNITGGLKVEDTALDLAVICAILSSNQDHSISNRIAFAGEVGLSGEVRPVQRIENRIKEAEKLGFEMILIAEANRKALKNVQVDSIKVRFVKRIEEVFGVLFD